MARRLLLLVLVAGAAACSGTRANESTSGLTTGAGSSGGVGTTGGTPASIASVSASSGTAATSATASSAGASGAASQTTTAVASISSASTASGSSSGTATTTATSSSSGSACTPLNEFAGVGSANCCAGLAASTAGYCEPAGSTGTTGTSGTTGTTGTTGTSGTTSHCAAAAELVYVVDQDNVFSSFTPGNPPTFNDIGTLNCPDFNGGTPFSMSVDRTGTAWVLYSDGTLFNVDTTTLACTATAYDSNATGWSNFGMGFTASAPNASTDVLFIANTAPTQLGTLDTSTLGVTTVGPLNDSPELTGNSLAQLWGFFPDANNPRVSEIDQTTGAEGTSFPMSALAGNPSAWAFAFYGGDFYVFLQRDSDPSTNVWYLDGSTGMVTEAITDSGRTIVGAGESTCVPVTTTHALPGGEDAGIPER